MVIQCLRRVLKIGVYILEKAATMCDTKQRQAGAEIAVTLSMVTAGETELDGFKPELDLHSEVVARIYRAMEICRRRSN